MNNRFSNWSDLRVFLAVLRSGSTLAASKALGMSQPTVSRRIEALEHALGLALFEKDTQGFHPTKAANALTADAEAAEAAMLAVQKRAEEVRSDETRVIRITAPPSSFSANFSRIISDFKSRHPNVQFQFLSDNSVIDLAAGEADIAIRFAQAITDDRLICTRMTVVKTALFASRDYAERHGLPRSPEELGGHAFIAYSVTRSSYAVTEWLKDRIGPEQVASVVRDPESALSAAMAGIGIAALGNSLVDENPNLVKCFDLPESLHPASWLVASPNAYRRPEVKAFMKFFAPRFRAIFAPKGNAENGR